MNGAGGLPVEQFIQALTSQLDRAQATLAMKARAGLPLTFAVKDLTIDLRAHFEMAGSAVHIRPAGPGDPQASTVHLTLTSITRPMIEENTVDLAVEPDAPSLREVVGEDISEDEVRRLEWAGIHNVSQLRAVQQRSGEETLQKVTQLPAQRLRQALARASRPYIRGVLRERSEVGPGAGVGTVGAGGTGGAGGAGRTGPPVLRIRGDNLVRAGQPQVRIGAERVPVLRASPREVLVAPLEHQLRGTLVVEVEPGEEAAFIFDAQEPGEREAGNGIQSATPTGERSAGEQAP